MEQVMVMLGYVGIFSPLALSAVGSCIGCMRAGMTACGAMLDTESGYGKFIGLSVLPSSVIIYGIVIMLSLQKAAAPGSPALFGIGFLSGVALLYAGATQGSCCAAAINASKSKPEIFGISVTPAAVVEGFAVFVFVFALILIGSITGGK
ncbi:MAG TPA: ATP synthase subunit C [bacterium]|nr:ATP synthase subunit C [bacterium]